MVPSGILLTTAQSERGVQPEEIVVLSEAIATEESETGLQARSQGACFVCGQDNPHGLRIKFELQDSGEAIATWAPNQALEGFRGIVHGAW